MTEEYIHLGDNLKEAGETLEKITGRNPNRHPGNVLARLWLVQWGIERLVERTDIPLGTWEDFVDGNEPATKEIDDVLTELLGTKPGLWEGMQRMYDRSNKEKSNE